MPRRYREDKVTFLRSSYEDGRRLEIPYKMRHSNIIDSASLPVCRRQESTSRPVPDPDINNMPVSYWPAADTPIIPEDTGAEEVWNSCRRSLLGNRRRMIRKPDNMSNSAQGDIPEDDLHMYEPSFPIADNYEMLRVLHKLEKMPPDQREDYCREIPPEDFCSEDFLRIQTTCNDRASQYLNVLRQTFAERDLGEIPESADPALLSREIKKRMRIQVLGEEM